MLCQCVNCLVVYCINTFNNFVVA